MSCRENGGGKDWPELRPRELSVRLASTVARMMFVVSEPTVMVEMRVLDGLFMESSLLDGGMYPY